MKIWKTYALLALFCIFSTMATRAQERKEFKFENGIAAYWVGSGDELGVEDINGKIIVPRVYGKMWCYGNLIYCKERKGFENKYACALYDYNGNCKISEKDGYTILDFVKYKGKWIATATVQKTVFDEKGEKLYEFKEEKDSNNFMFLRNLISNEIVVDSGLYWGTSGFRVKYDYICTHQGDKEGVVNFDGSPVLPSLYGIILPIGNKEIQGFIVGLSKIGGPEGVFDRNGNCIIPLDKYSSVSWLSNGMFTVVENGKAGIVDSLGNVKFMTNYQHINLKRDEADNYYYETSIGNGKGKMTLDGEAIEEPKPTRYERIKRDAGFKYIQVTDKNGLIGVNDTLGRMILPCEYNGIRYDKLPYMKTFGYWLTRNVYEGFADSNGKVIIPCDKYHHISDIGGGGEFFVVEYLGKKGLCDKNGTEIIKPLYDDIAVSKGLIEAHNGIKQGVLDVKGNVIVPIEYTSIIYNKEQGNYYVELFKKKGIYSIDGREILAPKYDYFIKSIEGEYIVGLNGKKGVCDENGREVIAPNKYDFVDYNSDGYYRVELNGKKGACDKSGKEIIAPKYNDLSYLLDVFEYKDASGKWVSLGISLDKNGNTYENPNFTYDKYFAEGHEYFQKGRYRKAAKNYKKALEYKQTALAYYNVAASYYNLDKYNDAITYFQYCLNNNPNETLENNAKKYINKSRQFIAQKEARREQIAEALIGGALAFTAGVVAGSMGVTPTPANPNTSGNMDYLLDPNYAIWQAQQQQAEMNAVNQQLINLSIWQTEQQEYETYLLMTSGGTSMTFDEWKALAAQAAMNESFNSDMSYFISDDPSEMEYKGKLSPDQYQAAYRSYENSAAGYYRALTTGGVRNQDKDGNIQGKTVGQISGGGYATWKQGLSKAQAEMRRIRQEAAQYGVTIQQSQWETATVSY